MAWSAPMTAVDLEEFTAGDFNLNIRDNLLETMPAKAGFEGDYFVTTGVNSLTARQVQEASYLVGGGTTLSLTYTDLSDTVGPVVTVETGSSALVIVGAQQGPTTGVFGRAVYMSFQVSGATSIAASDAWAFGESAYPSLTAKTIGSRAHLVTGLTPGTNTFTAKYRIGAGSGSVVGTFEERRLIVMPF